MGEMIQSTEGLIHFIAGVVALVAGASVLLLLKEPSCTFELDIYMLLV